MEQFDLKAWRKARNMTQAALASALKVTTRTVINWEQGDTVPAGNLLELACRALEETDAATYPKRTQPQQT